MSLPQRTKLGTVVFHGWNGWAPSVDNLGESFARIGQAGSGSQITGTRGAQKACSAWIGCTSKMDALAAAAAVEALVWTTVKMVDQWGATEPRVRISSASCEVSMGAGTKVTASAPMLYLVQCQITIEVLP